MLPVSEPQVWRSPVIEALQVTRRYHGTSNGLSVSQFPWWIYCDLRFLPSPSRQIREAGLWSSPTHEGAVFWSVQPRRIVQRSIRSLWLWEVVLFHECKVRVPLLLFAWCVWPPNQIHSHPEHRIAVFICMPPVKGSATPTYSYPLLSAQWYTDPRSIVSF